MDIERRVLELVSELISLERSDIFVSRRLTDLSDDDDQKLLRIIKAREAAVTEELELLLKDTTDENGQG